MNVTTKTLALAGGAITLLDYAMTVVVSASTTSEYIAGEVSLPFPVYVGTLIIVAVPLLVSLLGLKESARTALGILSFHVRETSFGLGLYTFYMLLHRWQLC